VLLPKRDKFTSYSKTKDPSENVALLLFRCDLSLSGKLSAVAVGGEIRITRKLQIFGSHFVLADRAVGSLAAKKSDRAPSLVFATVS